MGMGMIKWEWEGFGILTTIPAHLYAEPRLSGCRAACSRRPAEAPAAPAVSTSREIRSNLEATSAAAADRQLSVFRHTRTAITPYSLSLVVLMSRLPVSCFPRYFPQRHDRQR